MSDCKPRRCPPVRSTPQPTPAADKIRTACEWAEAEGRPITHAYLQAATGASKDAVWHAIAGMRRRGEWRWTLVLAPAAGRFVARPRTRERYWVPAPVEILLACRAILTSREVGLPADVADGRLRAKAMRYGE